MRNYDPTIALDEARHEWLQAKQIRVCDHRDDEGKERMHVRESAALEAQYGRLIMPASSSGRNLLNPEDAS